jgi:hypothetical protein
VLFEVFITTMAEEDLQPADAMVGVFHSMLKAIVENETYMRVRGNTTLDNVSVCQHHERKVLVKTIS